MARTFNLIKTSLEYQLSKSSLSLCINLFFMSFFNLFIIILTATASMRFRIIYKRKRRNSVYLIMPDLSKLEYEDNNPNMSINNNKIEQEIEMQDMNINNNKIEQEIEMQDMNANMKDENFERIKIIQNENSKDIKSKGSKSYKDIKSEDMNGYK